MDPKIITPQPDSNLPPKGGDAAPAPDLTQQPQTAESVEPNTGVRLPTAGPQPAITQPLAQPVAGPASPGAANMPPAGLQPTFSAPAQQPPNGVVSGEFTPPGDPYNPQPRNKKKLFMLGAMAAVLMLLVAGTVFGYYLPNQPNHVWATSVSRSGKALSKVVDSVTEKSKLEAFRKSDITMSVDAKYNDSSYKGSFTAKFDASKANGGLDFTAKNSNQPEQTFNAKFLGELPEGSQYPNVYFQLNGLKSFGLENYLPNLLEYEGKWIAVEASYLKSLGNVPTAEEAAKKQLTSDDIAELAKAATSATTNYVFSTDAQKAVFEKKGFVGKEKTDGINTYHYTVGLNKDHLKAYCKAMVNNIYSTSAYKKIPWVDEKTVDEDKKTQLKDCDDSSYDDLTNRTFDIWIETAHKLIYKIRIPEANDKKNYTDVGQVYKGGDDLSLFVAMHNESAKSDGKFSLDTNIKTATTKATLDYGSNNPGSSYSVKIILDAKPFSGEIDVKKPTNSIPIQEVLKKLGIDPSNIFGSDNGNTTSAPIQTKAEDNERQIDIRALQGQLEAYFAQNGYYPTLASFNDEMWRTANMKGLDKEALKDPKGQNYTLTSTPATNVYSYQVFGAGQKACNNTTTDCVVYTLTATLSDGKTYVKNSLN